MSGINKYDEKLRREQRRKNREEKDVPKRLERQRKQIEENDEVFFDDEEHLFWYGNE